MAEAIMVMPDGGEWARFVFVLLAIIGGIGISEFLRTLAGLHPEFSRKVVHGGVGFGILFAPSLFVSPVPLLLLSAIFVLVNLLAIKMGWLQGIHGQSRPSYGTVYFPIALFILVLLFWQRSPEIVALAMFAFSLGDAAAALVGESLTSPHTFILSGDTRSYEGSAAMAVVTFAAVVSGGLVLWHPLPPSWAFLLIMGGSVAVVATATEALSSRGLDNLTLPFVNALVLSVFLFPSTTAPVDQLLMGISLGLFIAALSYVVRFLTLSGSVATFLLASLVYGFGGWKWTMPMLAFFVLSSMLSFYGRHAKTDLASVFEKSSTRDHAQVWANGGIAGLLIVFQYAFPTVEFYPAYIGSLAAVTADTWGTEVGILSRGQTVSLVNFRPVARGTSGGVSIAGSVAGAAGALLVAAVGAQWVSSPLLLAGFVGGVAGSAVDSIVGESMQARFQCSVCGKETERVEHCNRATEQVSGLRFLRNDGVNIVCAVTGAVVAYLLV